VLLLVIFFVSFSVFVRNIDCSLVRIVLQIAADDTDGAVGGI
jgi:hypothetical protein